MRKRLHWPTRPQNSTRSDSSALKKALLLALMMILIAVLSFTASDVVAKQPGNGDGVVEIPIDEVEPTAATERGEFNALTGAPVALYQVNYPVEGASPEVMARQYLSENAGTLQIRLDDIHGLRHRVTRESLSGSTVRFTQTYGGIPVYNAEIVVHISNNNLVTFVMSQYKQGITLDDTSPALSLLEAQQVAFNHLNLVQAMDPPATTLVITSHQTESRLAYMTRVAALEPHGDWEVLVDANSGEIFKAVNHTLDFEGQEQGQPEANLVDGTGYVFDPDPLTTAMAVYGDPGFVDGNDAATPQLDGERVQVTLYDLTFDGTDYWLIGTFAEIQDVELPLNGLFEQPSSDFLFDRFDDAFEAANTYYHIDASMRYISQTLGLNIQPFQYPGSAVRFDPHGLNGADNSHYTAGRVAFGEGGVDDAEDSDVIHHELAHGLHDWVTNGSLSQVNGLSEGAGDYWAQSYNRSIDTWSPADPEYNWVFRWDGHNPFWPGRVTNWPALYPGGLTGQIHTDGQIWSTSMMKVWDAIGKIKADTAHWEGLAMTNSSTNQGQAANAVFQAAIDLGYSQADLIAMHAIFSATGYTMMPLPNPDFALDATPASQQICVPDDALYDIAVQSLLGYTGSVTLDVDASSAPAGSSAVFSPETSNAPFNSTLTIGNLNAGNVGDYSVIISGASATATHTTTVGLSVLDVPAMVTLLTPANGAQGIPPTPTFSWQAAAMADSYTLEVATDAGFGNIVLSESGISGTSFTPSTPLEVGVTYYWRVGAENVCGSGSFSAAFSFTTSHSVFVPHLAKPA